MGWEWKFKLQLDCKGKYEDKEEKEKFAKGINIVRLESEGLYCYTIDKDQKGTNTVQSFIVLVTYWFPISMYN